MLLVLLVGGVRLVSGIMGGSVADADRFPYFTRLNITTSASREGTIAGTLIAPDVVLTHAFGMTYDLSGDDVIVGIKVWVNKTTREKSPYEYERIARSWLLHPDWDAEFLNNDIALVFLDEPVMDVPLVKLNRKASIPETGQTLTEIGLGVTTVKPAPVYSEKLREVAIEAVSSEECEKAADPAPEMDMNNKLCAGRDYKGGCNGDGGGPLLLLSKSGSARADKDIQVGIDSFMTLPNEMLDEENPECNLPGYPGGFTRVAAYAEWIDSSVRKYSKVKRSKKAMRDTRKGRIRKSHKI